MTKAYGSRRVLYAEYVRLGRGSTRLAVCGGGRFWKYRGHQGRGAKSVPLVGRHPSVFW